MIDTDVVLDLLLDRQPFADEAAELFALAETGRVEALVAATTVTTVLYLAAKAASPRTARVLVRRLLSIVDVAPIQRSILLSAVEAPMSDFEDAVIAMAARSVGAAAIVTRNTRDYGRSPVPAQLPEVTLAQIAALGEDAGGGPRG